MKLSYKKTMLVGLAFLLIMAFWQAYDAIIPLILTNHFGLSQFASGIIMSIDNVLAVFLLPLFGSISDKSKNKLGRRTPFIIVGTVIATVTFVALTFVDNYQLKRLENAKVPEMNGLSEKEIAAEAFKVTASNPWPLVIFIAVLLVVLVAMAIFRSPAVALMPDVTVKPLRSKANAIINLMGTAGGISVLVLGMIFKTDKNRYMRYTGYIFVVAAIMILALIAFLLTVKERKWVSEMAEEEKRLGLAEEAPAEDRAEFSLLDSAKKRSLILILASVALWYIGYNSITSKYTVYASTVLGFDFNLTLIIAQIAAIISYVPVGIIASKVGRKKTILAGVIILFAAFFAGNFIGPSSPQLLMIPLFVLAGIGWATINVNSFPMAVELARGSDVGKYTGYYYTASMAAQIVAPTLSGLLYTIFPMRIMFFAFGSLFVGLSFVTMLFVKHGDSKPSSSEVLDNIDVD